MLATAGDAIEVRGFGKRARRGTVVETKTKMGAAYDLLLVRWEDGHTSLFIPGTGTTIEHRPHDDQTGDGADGRG